MRSASVPCPGTAWKEAIAPKKAGDENAKPRGPSANVRSRWGQDRTRHFQLQRLAIWVATRRATRKLCFMFAQKRLCREISEPRTAQCIIEGSMGTSQQFRSPAQNPRVGKDQTLLQEQSRQAPRLPPKTYAVPYPRYPGTLRTPLKEQLWPTNGPI